MHPWTDLNAFNDFSCSQEWFFPWAELSSSLDSTYTHTAEQCMYICIYVLYTYICIYIHILIYRCITVYTVYVGFWNKGKNTISYLELKTIFSLACSNLNMQLMFWNFYWIKQGVVFHPSEKGSTNDQKMSFLNIGYITFEVRDGSFMDPNGADERECFLKQNEMWCLLEWSCCLFTWRNRRVLL